MPDLGSGLKWFMVFSAAVLIVCPLTARGQVGIRGYGAELALAETAK